MPATLLIARRIPTCRAPSNRRPCTARSATSGPPAPAGVGYGLALLALLRTPPPTSGRARWAFGSLP